MGGYHCARESPIEYRSVPTGPPTPFIKLPLNLPPTSPHQHHHQQHHSNSLPQPFARSTPVLSARFSTVTSPSPTLSSPPRLPLLHHPQLPHPIPSLNTPANGVSSASLST